MYKRAGLGGGATASHALEVLECSLSEPLVRELPLLLRALRIGNTGLRDVRAGQVERSARGVACRSSIAHSKREREREREREPAHSSASGGGRARVTTVEAKAGACGLQVRKERYGLVVAVTSSGHRE